jgi:hypothetical protein
VADPDEVVCCSRGKPDSRMQIELLPRCDLMSRSDVQEVARPAGLRKIARVFGKGIPGFSRLSIQKKCGLTDNAVESVLGRHIDSQPSCRSPDTLTICCLTPSTRSPKPEAGEPWK